VNHAERYFVGVEVAQEASAAIGSVDGTRRDKEKIAEMVVGRLLGEWRLVDRWAEIKGRS
jgi:hypothetical protein